MEAKMLQYFMLLFFMNTYGIFAEQESPIRMKRQSGNPGDALVDAVFQVPIQTLTAVGTLVKSTRPVIMQVRQRLQQAQQGLTPPGGHPRRFSFPGRDSSPAKPAAVATASHTQSSYTGYQQYQQGNKQRADRRQDSQSQGYVPASAYNKIAPYQQQPNRGSSPHRFSVNNNNRRRGQFR